MGCQVMNITRSESALLERPVLCSPSRLKETAQTLGNRHASGDSKSTSNIALSICPQRPPRALLALDYYANLEDYFLSSTCSRTGLCSPCDAIQKPLPYYDDEGAYSAVARPVLRSNSPPKDNAKSIQHPHGLLPKASRLAGFECTGSEERSPTFLAILTSPSPGNGSLFVDCCSPGSLS